MTKYKSDIADSASAMMQLPETLEGMLQDIHGQVEIAPKKNVIDEPAKPNSPVSVPPTKRRKQQKVSSTERDTPKLIGGDELWTEFCSQCASENLLPKTIGKYGVMSFCKVDKDILATFRKYAVGGYSTQTIVNAILRSFILHYKKEFNQYRITEKSLL